MRSVRFITRRTCTICAEALSLVSDRVGRKGWDLEIVDADDSGLAAEFGDRVPVVLLDGQEVLAGRFGRREIRRVLR
ncbi:MAG: glutaredoxin family protein [Acidimicrobiia bacterium]